MLKNLLPALLLALSVNAAGQNSNRIAFTGGLHSANVNALWSPHPLATASQTTPRTGVHFGFIASVPLSPKSPLRFQPGLQFSAKGATQTQTLDTAQSKLLRLTDKQLINYIDIPVNLALALPLGGKTKLLLGGGPQFSLFYSGKTSQASTDTAQKFSFSEISDLPVGSGAGQFRIVHFGVNAQAGFEFGRVFFTANYGLGLSPYFSNGEKDFKHSTLGASLGIYLGRQSGARKPPAENKTTRARAKPQKPAPVKDKDKDGVPDATDACPELPGTASAQGCPDRDGDGIGDPLDHCPGRKGPAENHGCPLPDRDGDGISDKTDKCPAEPGSAKYNGCPVPDSDKDGLNDEADKCPQEVGTKENGGCPAAQKAPEVKKEIVEKVNTAARQIAFEHRKSELLHSSLPVLNEIATLMQQHPDLKLTVEGHTSLVGDSALNQTLSEQRAQTVKAYLESKGVAASRITAAGYGSSRPLRTGTSAADEAANRRVELKLSY